MGDPLSKSSKIIGDFIVYGYQNHGRFLCRRYQATEICIVVIEKKQYSDQFPKLFCLNLSLFYFLFVCFFALTMTVTRGLVTGKILW